ncbi:MAG TPA: hypothetical protein VG674_13055 [Amycolatopsis sp.]|nr:hypothetical protein [Amycolatopsis sp.]
MPDYDPPPDYTGTPNRFLLPHDTTLWRVHPQSRDATEFTPYRKARRAGDGRFDGSAEDPYAAFNAGLDAAASLASVLMGGIPAPYRGFRTIRRVSVARQRASALATAEELHLVSLCDAVDLNAVAQDLWLIHSEECHEPRVRRWASWIRDRAPWSQGFLWPPRGGTSRRAVVLFGDRCGEDVLDPEPLFAVDLDDEFGAVWLNGILVEFRARVMPPRR